MQGSGRCRDDWLWRSMSESILLNGNAAGDSCFVLSGAWFSIYFGSDCKRFFDEFCRFLGKCTKNPHFIQKLFGESN